MTAMDHGSAERTAVDQTALERDILATLMPGFVGFEPPEWLTQAFGRGLMAACVYGNNVRDRAQLRALGLALREAAPHALLAIDEEGGEVTRLSYLEGSPYPGAAVMGRIDDEAYSEEIGRRVAREILSAGFNLALGPVADVNSNPLNPVIGTRSFGATPELASRHVAAWVRGLEGEGAIACPKHFPGHGDTGQDSHHELPTVDATRELITRRDLPPFGAAFRAGARSVMTSHIVLSALDPERPATFSEEILRGLLREELGFSGVIVSDALDMQGASGSIGIPEAAVRALSAGCDLLCVGVDTTREQLAEITEHIAVAVTLGRLERSRVADAAERVRALSAASSGGISAGSVPPNGPHAGSGLPATAVTQAPELPGTTGARAAEPRAAVTPAELARIAASFAGVGDAREWLRAHPGASVLRVDTQANMAVGFAPWGPFAAASSPFSGQDAAAASFAARALHVLGPEPHNAGVPAAPADAGDHDAGGDAAAPPQGSSSLSGAVIVVGREIHRHRFARSAIDALRSSGTAVLVIEMGWPATALPDSPGSRYASLSTYGSSALIGAALLTLLESAAT